MAPSAIEVYPTESPVTVKQVSQAHWSEPVPFGGQDQWFYIPETKRFDLSRGSARKLVIDADDGVANHRGALIDPDKTVLVIIDMQNYFVHPHYRDHQAGLAAVVPTLKVIERCRREGIQVVFLNWGIDEHDLRVMPAAVQRGFCRNLAQQKGYGWHVGLGAELPDGQGRCLFKGTWNADIFEPFKAIMTENDLCFDKARQSGMSHRDEPLHRYLHESGKKTLLFAGVNTDQCVFGTVTDAYNSGFDCFLLSDCTGTMTMVPGAQEVTEYNIATNMGFVTNSQAVLTAESI